MIVLFIKRKMRGMRCGGRFLMFNQR